MGFINRIGEASMRSTAKGMAADADDGWWLSGNFFNTSLMWGYTSGVKLSAWARWTGITIPQSVTIKSAIVRVKLSSLSGTCAADYYFNDVNNAVAPTNETQANALVKTTAYTSQTLSSTGVKDIDVKTVIQELVNSFGFSNQAMMAVIVGTGSGTNNGTFDDYGSADAPRLIIAW